MRILLPLAAVGLTGLAALGIGRRLLGATPGLGPPSLLGLAGALGLAVLSLLAFAAGLLGLFRPWPLLAGLLGLVAIGWPGLVDGARAARLVARRLRPRTPAALLLLLWAAAILALGLVGAVAPPRYNDAVMHHVWFPSRYLAAGRLLPISVNEMYAAAYPVGVHVLFAVVMALGGDSAPAVLEWLAGGFLLLLVHGETEARAGPRAAALVTAAILASPTFAFLLGAANVDLTFFLLAAGSLAALAHGRHGLSGLLAGAASGTKPVFGLVPLAVGVLALTVAAARRRRPLGALTRFAVVGLVFASAQPLWRLATTGNPLYPLFWGGSDLAPGVLERLVPVLRQGRWSLLDLLGGNQATRPLDLFLSHGPLLLLLAPLAFLSRETRARAPLAVGAAGLALAVVLAVLALDRFLLLPILYLAPALGIALEGLLASGRGAAATVRMVAVAGLAWGLLWSGKLEASNLPYALGRESRDAFLVRWFKDYPIVRQARELLPQGAVLLRGCRLDLRNYYLDRAMVDIPMLALERGRLHETAASMRALLDRHGVTHILDCGTLGNLFVDREEEAAFRRQMVEIGGRDGKTIFALR